MWWYGIAAVIFGFIVMLGAIGFWLVGGVPEPEEMNTGIFQSEGGSPPPAVTGESLRVVTWNIHFGSGAEDPATRPSRRAVLETLDGITAYLRKLEADFVFLQESDFDSARSHGIDQMRYIARGAGFRYLAPTVTWKKGYVPYPPRPVNAHYGRVLSGQAVLSRYPLITAKRRRLPPPESNPWWYNLMYIDRSISTVRARVGSTDVILFNVHLEAFDRENRIQQARLLVDFFQIGRGRRNIMAGDFNALPTEADRKHNFPDEPDNDMRNDRTISLIQATALKEVIPVEDYIENESRYFTFPSLAPNRRLDYIWVDRDWPLVEARVLFDAAGLSDHLPVLAVLEWKR